MWRCAGAESGTKFEDVELSNDEPEWTEYDEKVSTFSPCTLQHIALEFPRSVHSLSLSRAGPDLVPASPVSGQRRSEHHGV